jgi:hypothetical protein
MKTRFRFRHRLDKLDVDGEIVEHLAGIEDSQLAGCYLRGRGQALAERAHHAATGAAGHGSGNLAAATAPSAKLNEKRTSLKIVRRALRGSGFWAYCRG